LFFSRCGEDVEEEVWKKIEWPALETDGLQQLKGDALQALNHKCEKKIIRSVSLFISICCSASSINAGR